MYCNILIVCPCMGKEESGYTHKGVGWGFWYSTQKYTHHMHLSFLNFNACHLSQSKVSPVVSVLLLGNWCVSWFLVLAWGLVVDTATEKKTKQSPFQHFRSRTPEIDHGWSATQTNRTRPHVSSVVFGLHTCMYYIGHKTKGVCMNSTTPPIPNLPWLILQTHLD